MKEASSLARKVTAAAISSASANRPHRDVHEPPGRALRIRGEQLPQQRRVHRARAQRVDPDALAGELHAQLAAEREHAALGGGVGDLGRGRAHHGDERRGVDDGAPALALHVGDGLLAAQVDRGEVDLLDTAPRVQAGGQDRVVLRRGDARVVERDVDRAAGGERRRERVRHLFRHGHIGRHEQASRLGGRLLARRHVHIHGHHVGALGRETADGGQPDAAPGPGDHGGPSLKSPHARSV
jgi:hypothetical protein